MLVFRDVTDEYRQREALSESEQRYHGLFAHMTEGAPLMVSAESAARIINIFCTAERSHAKGGAPLPLEK